MARVEVIYNYKKTSALPFPVFPISALLSGTLENKILCPSKCCSNAREEKVCITVRIFSNVELL